MPNSEVDVCIVGSGAGGGVLAMELAHRGFSVVVLEVGERVDRSRIPTVRPDWERHSRRAFPRNKERDHIVYGPKCDQSFKASRFKGVGGSTMHYEGFCTRNHPDDFRRATQVGLGADWPLDYKELVPHYDRVERMLSMSGVLDNPFDPPRSPYPNPAIAMSCAVKAVKRGADKLGLHTAHAPLAILSKPVAKRAACNFCGGCWSGCFMGAISNISQTYLPVAEKKGAEIRMRAMATRVVINGGGKRVRGVEYLDRNGNMQLQYARVVALCGNAIETPRLLLMSSRSDHPEGLANSSGLVGRHFSSHTLVSAKALMDERVDAYKGPNINGMIQDFYDHDEKRDFAGGYVIALRNAESGPLHFHTRWAKPKRLFGTELLDYMAENFGHSVALSAYGEHFATESDRVTLDSEKKDSFGLPAPHIEIQLRGNEQRMLAHMKKTVLTILEAAGGQEVSVHRPPSFISTHLLGSCRMGNDPGKSVADPFGETHDVTNLFIADSSLFPTSTPGNPTITIQALATRVAERIAVKAKRG